MRSIAYHNLKPEEKNRFEHDIIRFFNNVTGVNTVADLTDRLLVDSSAVIPVFGFPEWHYTFLHEVLYILRGLIANIQLTARKKPLLVWWETELWKVK